MRNKYLYQNTRSDEELAYGYNVVRPIHEVGIIVCMLFYMIVFLIMSRLSPNIKVIEINFYGLILNNSIVCGILAQLQLMALILIVINPYKKSKQIATILCCISATLEIINTIMSRNIHALPGIGIIIVSFTIITIISQYGKNLHNQMERVVLYSEIVEKNDEMLHRLAYYDTLTELPNRRMMLDRISLLTDPDADVKEFIYVYFDLDNFKKINDLVGHTVGDMIIKQITKRLKDGCHQEDFIARIGGDEFALLIQRKLDRNEILEYLEGLRSLLAETIIIGHNEIHISACFGISIYPYDGNNADELLKNADIALYMAKKSGNNMIQFIDKEIQDKIMNRILIENGLPASIRNNELYMVYQPQYLCDSRTLRGYEALVRWKHPELGLVSPAQFIPIAEETGIINEIGSWIIETVLTMFKDYQTGFEEKPIVAINISVIQIIEPNFVPMVKSIIQKTGFDPNYLEFEITESVLMTYPEHVVEVLSELRRMGIRIALDDFGTGYASLNYLQMLPINVLKIDKSFINKIISEQSVKLIVGYIISLSHKLGIEVVAEGVEIEEQLNYLKENHCDYIQGFLLSKPIEKEQLVGI